MPRALDWLWEPTLLLIQQIPQALSPEGKWPGHKTDYFPSVQRPGYISTLLRAFIAHTWTTELVLLNFSYVHVLVELQHSHFVIQAQITI